MIASVLFRYANLTTRTITSAQNTSVPVIIERITGLTDTRRPAGRSIIEGSPAVMLEHKSATRLQPTSISKMVTARTVKNTPVQSNSKSGLNIPARMKCRRPRQTWRLGRRGDHLPSNNSLLLVEASESMTPNCRE